MNRPLLIGAGAVFLAGMSYLFYSRFISPAPDRGHGYFYCPKCGLETLAAADQKDRKIKCPRCGPWPQEMVYSRWSHAEAGSSENLLVPVICIGGLGALGLVYAYISVLRPAMQNRKRVVKVYLFRCPDCRRKFRVTENQAGHEFTCPKCHHRVIIPAPNKA
jgi:DNA-directed RNA polymerase subunit RPC12/RpoP